MSRYKVTGAWVNEKSLGDFILQCADITDTQDGRVYHDGAYRVISAHTDKPAKTGKGGTVPFYGECAWSDGERLLSDLYFAERFA